MPAPIPLLLVDDHPMWRQTLREALEHMQVGKVVGEAADGEAAVEAARRHDPDVVVMDIDLPGMDGVEATRRILEHDPDTKVLVLSASEEQHQVLAALRAGAAGYLIKTVGPAEVAQAIGRVHGGEMVLPTEVAESVREHLRHGGIDPIETLTEAERDVLDLIAQGRSNQAIAQKLTVSLKTVESRVGSVFVKLGLEPAPNDHRRVLAVLAHLRSQGVGSTGQARSGHSGAGRSPTPG